MHKNKFMDQIVNNIYLINIKFDMCVKNIKNYDFQPLEFQISPNLIRMECKTYVLYNLIKDCCISFLLKIQYITSYLITY